MSNEDFDPFDQQSTPAVSWTTKEDSDTDLPVGTVRYFETTGKADWVQQRNFDTGKPDTWDDGNPKMAAVVPVIEHAGPAADAPVVEHQHKGGEEQAIWAGKAAKGNTGALFNQIAKAQREAGAKIGPRGQLVQKLVEKKKDESNPSKKAQKVWLAKYTPDFYPARTKAEAPQDDPFAAGSSAGSDDQPPF